MDTATLRQQFNTTLSTLYSAGELAELWLILGEKILGKNRMELRQNLPVNAEQEEAFSAVFTQLLTGKPYQQILGEAWFYGLPFFVNENVLVPRPETEELAELAIKELSGAFHDEFKLLDIGTGSGILPIILKKHFPQANVYALDYSKKALEVAAKNARNHGTEIHFMHVNYLEYAFTEELDVIISNPPYISQSEELDIASSVKDFEPRMALFSPTSDPLIFYKKIAKDGLKHLSSNGKILLEINQKLGMETLELFNGYNRSELLKDLSGNDRFIVASL